MGRPKSQPWPQPTPSRSMSLASVSVSTPSATTVASFARANSTVARIAATEALLSTPCTSERAIFTNSGRAAAEPVEVTEHPQPLRGREELLDVAVGHRLGQPRERLVADHPAVGEADDRLVGRAQRLCGEHLGEQVAPARAGGDRKLVLGAGAPGDAVAADPLRLVQRLVGAAPERGAVVPGRAGGVADADPRRAAADGGAVHRALHPLADGLGLGAVDP